VTTALHEIYLTNRGMTISTNDTLQRAGAAGRRRRRGGTTAIVVGLLVLAGATALSAHAVRLGSSAVATRSAGQAPGDSAAVAAVVERFHAAVVAGDSALALSLLTPDVVVLESGGIETREEFRSRHLAADIAFAQAVKSERGPMRVVVRGDAAWVSSTSSTTGEYRGRQVDSSGAELMVLSRTPQGWRIAAIHWSSRTRRPPGG
jgi:ketosteroid isomerase-like protein